MSKFVISFVCKQDGNSNTYEKTLEDCWIYIFECKSEKEKFPLKLFI